MQVHGQVTGQIFSDSHVTIFKSGSLDGAVNATGFTVEKGGIFQGELTITPRQGIRPVSTDDAEGEGEDRRRIDRLSLSPGAAFLGGEPNPAHG